MEEDRAVLMLRGLDVVPVEYGNMKDDPGDGEVGMRPRDSLHLAVMKRISEKAIVRGVVHQNINRVEG